METNIDIKLETVKQISEKKLSMPEFQAENKAMTSYPKLNILKENIPHTNALLTLEAGSTSKEVILEPFWNNYSKGISKKLWFPTKIDGQDLDGTCSNGFSHSMVQNSWHYKTKQNPKNKNCLKTSWQSFIHSLPEVMDKEPITTSRTLRIYPNKNQKEFLNRCFGTTRYLFNKSLNKFNELKDEYFNEQLKLSITNGCSHKTKIKNKYVKCKNELIKGEFLCKEHIGLKKYKILPNVSKIGFSRSIVVKKKDLDENEKWLDDIPYDTRTLAVRSFIESYESQKELLKLNLIKDFNINYKSCKNKKQVCFIDHSTLKNNFHLFPRKFKKNIRLRKKGKKYYLRALPEGTANNDFKIIRNNGKYYCNVMIENIDNKNNKNKKDFVALDPGVRTFQSYYSPDGEYGKYGDGEIDKIFPYALKVDKYQSIHDKFKNKELKSKSGCLTKTLHNLLIKCSSLRTKMRNKIDDLHKKVSKDLCSKFKNIFLPLFDTKNMVKMLPEQVRNISCKTVRKMLGLSHGRFRNFIIRKAKMMGSKVWLCSEAYTSKTCTSCGTMYKIGSSKIFKCSKCDFKMDRDIHAARNILIRTFKTISSLL